MPSRSRFAMAGAAVLALSLTTASAAAQAGAPNNSSSIVTRVAAGTKLKQVNLPAFGVSTPGPMYDEFFLRVLLRLYPVSPTVAGGKPVNGKFNLVGRCFGEGGISIHETVVKVKDGVGAYAERMPGGGDCNFVEITTLLKGNAALPFNTDVSVSASTVPIHPMSTCVPDQHTLCLGGGGRFQTRVEWRDGGKTQAATGDQRGDDEGTFWFFNPENWEMLVKVIDGCDVNDRFWVFAGGLTDVEASLTVTDTYTGTTRRYLGSPMPAVTDTSAFATCP